MDDKSTYTTGEVFTVEALEIAKKILEGQYNKPVLKAVLLRSDHYEYIRSNIPMIEYEGKLSNYYGVRCFKMNKQTQPMRLIYDEEELQKLLLIDQYEGKT